MAGERVSDLMYVGLAVPDLAAERQFFGPVWGLTETGEEDGKVYFAAEGSAHPFVIQLRQNAEAMTDIIGFSAASREDVDAIFARVKAMGASIIAEPAASVGKVSGYGFRFFDLEGRAIEVLHYSQPRAARQLAKGEAIPTGLSHIVLHSPDPKALSKFYEDALGFRLSDWLAEFMVFLRCNAVHHRLAILPGPPCLDHIAFDVSSVDELMRGLSRMRREGVELHWGPGRHTAGNNTFTYYKTPNGNTVEYTSDLEEVDEQTWQPQVYEFRPDITDQWGTGRMIVDNPFPQMKPDGGLWKKPA